MTKQQQTPGGRGKKHPLTERVMIRLSAHERRQFTRQAMADGLSLSTWIRRAALHQSREP